MTIEEREKKYGWISKKYDQALSALAGNEVEIEDDVELSIKPVVSESCELTTKDIIDIHDKMVDDFGGEYGIRDESLLASLRDAPYTEFFGEAQYPTVLSKAAKYLFDFTFYQVFIDGNKRVGLSVANAFLAAYPPYCQESDLSGKIIIQPSWGSNSAGIRNPSFAGVESLIILIVPSFYLTIFYS